MKQEVIGLIENLEGFLGNIKAICDHPYSTGVDVKKLINDLTDYAQDLKVAVNKIEEVSVDFVGEPDREENSN